MKITRAELENANRALEKENHVLSMVLGDVYHEAVTWFGRHPTKIGIVRPNAASGGFVVTVMSGYVRAYLFEEWFPAVRDYIPDYRDDEAIHWRNMALEANEYVQKCHALLVGLPSK